MARVTVTAFLLMLLSQLVFAGDNKKDPPDYNRRAVEVSIHLK